MFVFQENKCCYVVFVLFSGKLYGSVAALVKSLSCAFWRIYGKARGVSLLRLLSRAEVTEKQEADAGEMVIAARHRYAISALRSTLWTVLRAVVHFIAVEPFRRSCS